MFTVKFSEDYIAIHYNEQELVGWTMSEWIEDPSVVLSIANAVYLAGIDTEALLDALNGLMVED